MKRRFLLTLMLLLSLHTALGQSAEVISTQDTNYTFTVLDDTDNPLTGAACTADIYYDNNTAKFTNLTATEVGAGESPGLYSVSFGSGFTQNETGQYTFYVRCASGSFDGADSEKFAIVNNTYSFVSSMWQIAIMTGLVGIAFIFANFFSENESMNAMIRLFFLFGSLFFMLTATGFMLELSKTSTTVTGILNLVENSYTGYLWLSLGIVFGMVIYAFKDYIVDFVRGTRL